MRRIVIFALMAACWLLAGAFLEAQCLDQGTGSQDAEDTDFWCDLNYRGVVECSDGRKCNFIGDLGVLNLCLTRPNPGVIMSPDGKYLVGGAFALDEEESRKRGFWPVRLWGNEGAGWILLVTTARCEPVRLLPVDVMFGMGKYASWSDVDFCFVGDTLNVEGSAGGYYVTIKYREPDFREVEYQISSSGSKLVEAQPGLHVKVREPDYLIRKDGSVERLSDGRVCEGHLKKAGGGRLRFQPYLGGRKIWSSANGRYVAVSGALHPEDNPNPDDLPCEQNIWDKGWDSVFLIVDVGACRLANVINMRPGSAGDVFGRFSRDGSIFFAGSWVYETMRKPGIPLAQLLDTVEPLVNPPAVFRHDDVTIVVITPHCQRVLVIEADGTTFTTHSPYVPGNLLIPVYADGQVRAFDVRGTRYLPGGSENTRLLALANYGDDGWSKCLGMPRYAWEPSPPPKGFEVAKAGYAYLPLPPEATDLEVRRAKDGGYVCSYVVSGTRRQQRISKLADRLEPSQEVLAAAKALAEGKKAATKSPEPKK